MVVGGGVKGRNISLILIPRPAGAGKGRSLEGGGVWQRGGEEIRREEIGRKEILFSVYEVDADTPILYLCLPFCL